MNDDNVLPSPSFSHAAGMSHPDEVSPLCSAASPTSSIYQLSEKSTACVPAGCAQLQPELCVCRKLMVCTGFCPLKGSSLRVSPLTLKVS